VGVIDKSSARETSKRIGDYYPNNFQGTNDNKQGFDQTQFNTIYISAPLTGITSFEKFVVYRNAISGDAGWFTSIQYYQTHSHMRTNFDNRSLPNINKNT
jgi:hypothetical protein